MKVPAARRRSSTSGTRLVTGALQRVDLGSTAPPERVLWNFPLHQGERSSGKDWKGSILAPDAAVTIPNGNSTARSPPTDVTINSPGFDHHPFGGCLPPAPPPPEPSRISRWSRCAPIR